MTRAQDEGCVRVSERPPVGMIMRKVTSDDPYIQRRALPREKDRAKALKCIGDEDGDRQRGNSERVRKRERYIMYISVLMMKELGCYIRGSRDGDQEADTPIHNALAMLHLYVSNTND